MVKILINSAYIIETLKKEPSIISKQGLLDSFNNQDWSELWVILIAHTIKRLMYRYGIKKSKSMLKDDADSILSDVLSLIVIEGRRNWNQQEYATFKEFVISVIDSHLYSKFTKTRSLDVEINEETPHPIGLNEEEKLLYTETRKYAFDQLETMGAKDDELVVFECMADGIVKPEFIKKELGLSANDFRNIWRRLKPRIEELKIKMSKDD